MRTVIAWVLYPLAALFSLVVIVVATPINVAMRQDRRARDEADLLRETDDLGADVDEDLP